MKQVFQKSYLSKDLCVEEVPAPALTGDGVIVRNHASLISPGTERTTVSFARKGLLAKIQSQPERVKLLMRKMRQIGIRETFELAMRKLDAPIPMGYSTAGVVTEVSPGLGEFRVGDRVACAGAKFANHAEMVYIPKNLCVKLPDSLSFEEGSFVAPGAIALHGVRLANIGLGETVVVIGLGLIGQLSAQLVRAQGARVIGIDLSEERLKLARQSGVVHALNRQDSTLPATLKELTDGRGADVVLVCAATQSSDPVTLAGEIARDRAKVVIVGDVGMQIPRSIYYQKELSVLVSRSYGPGRYDEEYELEGRTYPAGYIRWSERDNMAAFLQLAAEGKLSLKPLIDRRYEVSQAKEAYDLLADASLQPQPLGIVLSYPGAIEAEKTLALKPSRPGGATGAKVGLGVVGAGNFLRGVLLPALQKQPEVILQGICTRSGLSARNTGQEFGFGYCTTEWDEVLKDGAVQAVVIGTRHDSHAELICQSLAQNRHVFVEKPLAITPEELAAVVEAHAAHADRCVMTGFNRRFAPISQTLKTLLDKSPASRPLSIQYRVNAGVIEDEHWTHQDGGRVVGEVCHFVDWCVHLSGGEMPVSVYAQRVGEGLNHDLLIQLTLSGGSVANIQYVMRSDTALGKERIEVFSPALTAEIDDFKSLRWQQGGKIRQETLKKQAKGHTEEVRAFIEAVRLGQPSPIPFEQQVAVTACTFAILESLQTRQPVAVPRIQARD